ncbi:MAG: DUF192 domain-containing protein [Nanoarchaeota archaeon]
MGNIAILKKFLGTKNSQYFLFFLLIFAISCAKNLEEIEIDNGKKLIKVNAGIADDNEERATGLMFRERLDKNSGMLFIFEQESEQAFWMKNTFIALDIIFIDRNFTIVDIKNAVPCKVDPCVLYRSSKPAKYVLEVNENFTVEHEIMIGNKIITKIYK